MIKNIATAKNIRDRGISKRICGECPINAVTVHVDFKFPSIRLIRTVSF